jgi:hypothetical protein
MFPVRVLCGAGLWVEIGWWVVESRTQVWGEWREDTQCDNKRSWYRGKLVESSFLQRCIWDTRDKATSRQLGSDWGPGNAFNVGRRAEEEGDLSTIPHTCLHFAVFWHLSFFLFFNLLSSLLNQDPTEDSAGPSSTLRSRLERWFSPWFSCYHYIGFLSIFKH